MEEKMKEFLDSRMKELRVVLGTKTSPEYLFYYREEILWIALNTETKDLLINQDGIYSDFQNQFSSEIKESPIDIQRFILEYLSQYLKIKFSSNYIFRKGK